MRCRARAEQQLFRVDVASVELQRTPEVRDGRPLFVPSAVERAETDEDRRVLVVAEESTALDIYGWGDKP